MNNKNEYLTNLAYLKSLGNSYQSNELAKEINKDFKGELLLNNIDKNILDLVDNIWSPIPRNSNKKQDFIFETIKLYGNFIPKNLLEKEYMVAENCDEKTAKNSIKAILANKRQFFSVNKKWGISDFKLIIDSQDDQDVIYKNYINVDELNEYKDIFTNIEFEDDYSKTIWDILKSNKIEKISLKTILYYIWKSDKSLFDNVYILENIDKSKLISLINNYIYINETLDSYLNELVKESSQLKDVKEIITKEEVIVEEPDEIDITLPDNIVKSKIDIINTNGYLYLKDIIDEYYNDEYYDALGKEKNSLIEEYLVKTLVDNRIEYANKIWYTKVNFEEDDKNYIIDLIKENNTLNSEYIIKDILGISKEHPKFEDLSYDIVNMLKDETSVEYLDNFTWGLPIIIPMDSKNNIIAMIKEKECLDSEYIIKSILNINKKHPKFIELSNQLVDLLSDSKEIVYLDNFSWGLPLDIPEEANDLPSNLYLEEVIPSENAEGDVFDQELNIDGFEGTLRSDIYNPLCEDVFDEDINKTIYNFSNDKQKCVLKNHHKVSGTFPLCQIAPDFFSNKLDVFPITVSDENISATVYINKNTRIITGLGQFYENINDISGRIFYLEKTNNNKEYKFILGETEKSCHIDANRALELLEIKSRLENESLTLYDIICEILEKRPIDFMQIVTEINLIKRVSRLNIASVLSSYHCFNNNKKNGKWNLDSKKIDLGFNKTKKKYIKK